MAALDNAVERVLVAELDEDEGVLQGNAHHNHDLDGEIERAREDDGQDDDSPREPDPELLQMLGQRHLRVFHRRKDPVLKVFEELIEATACHCRYSLFVKRYS